MVGITLEGDGTMLVLTALSGLGRGKAMLPWGVSVCESLLLWLDSDLGDACTFERPTAFEKVVTACCVASCPYVCDGSGAEALEKLGRLMAWRATLLVVKIVW